MGVGVASILLYTDVCLIKLKHTYVKGLDTSSSYCFNHTTYLSLTLISIILLKAWDLRPIRDFQDGYILQEDLEHHYDFLP